MDHPTSTDLSAAAAIQSALAAEARAMEAVANCRTQAEHLLDAARRQASDIAAQADLQISEIHKTYHKRIRKQEEKAQEGSHRHRLPSAIPSESALQTAVSQLAAWLTGAEDTLTPTPPEAPTP